MHQRAVRALTSDGVQIAMLGSVCDPCMLSP